MIWTTEKVFCTNVELPWYQNERTLEPKEPPKLMTRNMYEDDYSYYQREVQAEKFINTYHNYMKRQKEATFMDIMKSMFADVVDATKRDMGVELGMLANKKATELVLSAVKVPAIFKAGISDNPLIESIIGMVVATVLKNVFTDNEKAMKAADVMVQASVATLVRSADLGNILDRLLGGIALKDLRFATGTEEKEKVIVAGD